MRRLLVAATVLSCACANAAQILPPVQGTPAPPASAISKRTNARNGSLKAVKSESALRQILARVRKQREAQVKEEQARSRRECLEWSKGLPGGPFNCDKVMSESVTVTGAAATIDVDTNTQHDGIDEGGLVKKAGDILVVLRRGRLFTIDTSGAQLATVDMANLASQDPQSDHQSDWYDELLIADRTVIVIGYSNSRQGSEIVLFDLRERGRLEYRATYNLRSDDYYSGANYASRLVAGRLILYTTRPLPDNAENLEWMPAMRQWHSGGSPQGFERIAGFDRVFTPSAPLSGFPTVHTMITCDPSAPTFTCEGTVILGGYLSVYYASPGAAYAWTYDYTSYPEMRQRSVVYRLPFDGSPITALQVAGEPKDQFAFLESDDAHLNVVVRLDADDESRTSLLRVPLDAFADGSRAAPPESFRELVRGDDWMSVRFIGESVILGSARDASLAPLIVTRWRSRQVFTLPLQHNAERIEAIGNDAIVVGRDGDGLGMTTISLAGEPSTGSLLRVARAQQAESRSHGFLYRAESAREGMFGLPLLIETSSIESASVVFIRNRNLALQPAGSLNTTELEEPDDHCVVSCVDWYGNARAIFSGPRVFALMGYELVEGRIDANGQVSETGRLNFNPAIEKSKR